MRKVVLTCVLCALNGALVHAAGLEIGWAERDITPSLDGGKKIPLAGQYYIRDATGRKTGVFVNTACPSQVMELSNVISSDFAGAMREKLAKRHGGNFHSIYHLGAAGCQILPAG